MKHVWLEHRRAVLFAGAAVGVVITAMVVLNVSGGSHAFSLSEASGGWAYVAVFALVFGDAVFPVLPGETTLNAPSTLAAEGSLHLGTVMLAGTLGAIVGDSTLYWIARLFRRRIRPQVDRLEHDERVSLALEYVGSSAPPC